MLQERIDCLGEWIDELESIDVEIADGLSAAEIGDRVEEIIDEIQSTAYSGQ